MAIDQADVIVTIGHEVTEKPPFVMRPGGPTVIHIGYSQAAVEQVYFPQVEVIGDIGRALPQLADRIEGAVPNADALLPLRATILEHIADRAEEQASGSRATTAPRWPIRCCWTTRWRRWARACLRRSWPRSCTRSGGYWRCAGMAVS
ncbi:hypothetical protein G6F57_021549 [Rhizopus arrhizus]|nr:hypothetical protein G6F57_021549 [Rhizopus arrhizus]